MRYLTAAGLALGATFGSARADEVPAEVQGLALSNLAGTSQLAQVDVETNVRSLGGVLGAESSLGLGLGRGFAVAGVATVHEDNSVGGMDRTADLGGALSFAWRQPERISKVQLGASKAVGSRGDLQLRAGAATRTTGTSWLALALELGFGERLDGTIAAAAGSGRGPIVPAIELEVGRCQELCAMGSVGVRVRLPAELELGLAVLGEALPTRQVGMALSFRWTQQLLEPE